MLFSWPSRLVCTTPPPEVGSESTSFAFSRQDTVNSLCREISRPQADGRCSKSSRSLWRPAACFNLRSQRRNANRTPARARSRKTFRGSSEPNMNAALPQVARPVLPEAFGRRGEQLPGPSLQRDETFQPLARRQPGSVLRRATIFSREIHLLQGRFQNPR